MKPKLPRYAPDDPEAARRLWAWSVERTGVDFPDPPG
jgi:hypothetical protein